MAQGLTVSASVRGAYSSVSDLAVAVQPTEIVEALTFRRGTDRGQADQLFTDTRSLSASASELIDVTNLVDGFGVPFSTEDVVAIYVRAAKTNVGDILVGGAASNPLATPFGDPTDVVKVRPGGVWLLAADGGYDAIGKFLKVANSGASAAQYDIVLMGRSTIVPPAPLAGSLDFSSSLNSQYLPLFEDI